MRVRITKAPLEKAAYGKQVQGSLSLNPGAFGGADYTASDKTFYKGVKDTLSAVPRDKANLEAEGGETAFGPISGQSIPDHLKIVGKRHHEGGVPLNLPDDTFIFSDTASLKINDPSILAMFNKIPKKGGYTPAELAKPYNINKYKSILLDPDSSKLERDTATIMIKNYIMKLGALALVQESMKGFPQGIPAMAKPYMEANGISEEDLMPELKQQADALAQSMGAGQEDMQMPQEGNPMMAEEMQQMAPDQAMQQDQAMLEQTQGQPSYPEQMPSGAPVASPEMMQQMAGSGSMPPPDMMPAQGMMAYGGMPYAQYGMTMGGYDMPFYPEQMAYGGVPKFVNGGPGNGTITSSSSSNTISDKSRLAEEYNKTGKVTSAPVSGRTYVDIGVDGVKGWGQESLNERNIAFKRGTGTYHGTDDQYIQDICKRLKYGNLKGVSAKTAIDKLKVISPTHSKRAEWELILQGCEQVDKKIETQFIKSDDPGKEPCLCLNADGTVYKDANGNTKPAPVDENGVCQPNDPSCSGETESLLCKCEDPVTGEIKEFPISEGEECVCEDGSSGQTQMGMGMQPQPHWSRAARTNITRNAFMATEPAASNVVLPPSAQVKGAYEEYQTKVDQGLAALSRLGSGIMAGMSGTTGDKQSMMKDLLGQSVRASMDAVAGVQSRNVDRQRETNVQDATIANTNALARTSALQGALDQQSQRKNTAMANRNQRRFNTLGAVMDADKEMAARQNMNVTTPQYASEYEYGFIAPTGVQKPFTGVGGATLEDRIQHYLAKTGDYQEAFDMAYKEARLKSQYGGQILANGGYVLASNVFPFIM